MIQEFGRAKINLTLDILRKREDGFHEISMLMQTVKLADTVELSKISSGITLDMDATEIVGGETIPVDEKNLACKAAKAVCDYCGEDFGVAINLHKKIPAAAGLAGGSADAAAVIRGMNRLYGLRLNNEKLCKIGEQVGSDVPFCIVGGTCLAEGRGEILTKLPDLKEMAVVLAKPRGEIPTGWAYNTYDLNPVKERLKNDEIISLLNSGDYDEAFKKFANVFEGVAVKKYPVIEKYKSKMLDAGAKVALISGTGPTVFALTDKKNSEKIASSVDGMGAQVYITKTFSC